ncbi:MAG: hypothetical protein M1830_000474, partial [Pleopsidium flavum]
MAESTSFGMVNPAIFEHLQAKIDEDAQVREELRNILQILERQVQNTIQDAEGSLSEQVETISKLAAVASRYPYYKYNGMWTRDIQNAVGTSYLPDEDAADSEQCFAVVLCGWLGGSIGEGRGLQPGRLLTIEEVGQILDVPVNLKERDAFHLTIEEYLQSLISLIEELARLAVNSVTLGDYHRPLQISRFVKDLHAGFQILNLKNDSLRRRSDSIKYNVKKIEDVVYDLSLRDLVPR